MNVAERFEKATYGVRVAVGMRDSVQKEIGLLEQLLEHAKERLKHQQVLEKEADAEYAAAYEAYLNSKKRKR